MKSKKILAVLLTLLTVLTVFSFSAYALNWDGSSVGGSTNAVNGSATGYVIRSTNDSNCVVGYRFSVVNEAGNMKVNKVIDVFRNTGNGDNAYSTSAKFTTKYNKKQLIANKNAKLTTSVNTTNCYKEKDMGFVSALPNPSGVETWQAYETNINKVLSKLGVGTVSNMYYGDKVIIEPLFDTCLAGEYQALTVTEIAYCGRSVLGGSSDGGTSKGNSSTWGFIANYTNRIWPNKLYTPNGQGLWTAASAIGSSTKATFDNILTKGYGAGIAYNETTNMLYTIAYNANGGSGSMSSHTTTSSATIKTNAFTKTGYTFSGWIVKRSDNKYYHSGSTGWSTSSSSAKVYKSGESHNFSSAAWRYSSGNSGTLLDGNRTFTFIAQWTPITYTVTYNANGGSGAPSAQTKTYGVDLTLSSTKPTRTGYTFNGWNTKSDGSGTNYVSGGKYTSNANLTLYAKWTPVTYTVTYNANGGSGAPGNQTKTYGVDLTLSSTKPTRTGYNFNGWNTKSDGSGTNYASGGKYTTNANLTLYAKWTPISYTVKYYLDGVEQTSLRQTCTYGTSYSYQSLPTKTGYTVTGWWSGSSSSSKGTQYTAGSTFSNLTSTNGGTVNRYAYSTPNTYTVKYYLDGVEQTSLKQTCTYGTSYSYKSLPTKAGYTVSGWWSGSSSSSKGTQYTAGSSFSNLTSTNGGTVNRYAYTDATSYMVKYYLDGTEQTSLRQTCTYGASYKYPSLPTKTGYTITGWWSGSSSSSKGTQYTAGNSFSNLSTTNGGTVNRYAYSTPITYQVKFNGNGNTSGTMSNQSFTYDIAQNLTANAFKRAFTVTFNYNGNGTANTTATANATFNGWAKSASGSKVYNDKQSVKNLSSKQGDVVNIYAKWTDASVILPTPTRTGYVFNGWYTSSSGGTKVGAGGASYTPSANITLYAQWTPITYTIKYNGNTNTGGSTASSTHTYDVSKALTTNGFTKTGYKFVNWNTKADGSGTSYTNQQSVKNLTTTNGATINLYAQWTPITYTINFNGNGNTSGSTASMSMTYDVAKNLTANGFSKTGYIFSGWNTKTDGSGTSYTDKQSVKNLSSTQGATITLYAKWTPITYTVKYNANGGSGSTASSTHTYDVAKNLTANSFTKTGYIFKSWNTKADGSGTSYTDKQSVKNLTTTNGAVINLYAQWTPITYTIKFDGNGNTSGSTASMTMTYDVAKALTANGFKKTDHTFTCWSLEKDGQGPCYADKQSVKNMTTVNGGVVTLYAQWEEDRKLSLEAITPNAAYRETTDVITSFNIINEGSIPCYYEDNVSVEFKVYRGDTVIKTVTLNNVVVPGNEKNLLYFKWTVPENLNSGDISITGQIKEGGKTYPIVRENYVTCKYIISTTPDTQYEPSAPDGFVKSPVPTESKPEMKWSVWTCNTNKEFVKVNYGLAFSTSTPVITPAANSNSSLSGGFWVMKSGYSFEMSFNNGVREISGYEIPTAEAFTWPQYSVAKFPEFNYLGTVNNYKTLELVNNNWVFRTNGNYGRVHFTPLWYPDGEYVVHIQQSDMWTPAGMITQNINTNQIKIKGSAYDDWYID